MELNRTIIAKLIALSGMPYNQCQDPAALARTIVESLRLDRERLGEIVDNMLDVVIAFAVELNPGQYKNIDVCMTNLKQTSISSNLLSGSTDHSRTIAAITAFDMKVARLARHSFYLAHYKYNRIPVCHASVNVKQIR